MLDRVRIVIAWVQVFVTPFSVYEIVTAVSVLERAPLGVYVQPVTVFLVPLDMVASITIPVASKLSPM